MTFIPYYDAILNRLRGEETVPQTPAYNVYFDTADPSTPGTIFTDVDGNVTTGGVENTLYISSVDASTWIYEGGIYVTQTITAPATTPFYITGTTIDAGGNKTVPIHHLSSIRATEFQVGTAYKFTTAAPTAGKVLGYVSPGVAGWITASNGGLISITPHDNGVPVYYATVDLAFAASTPGDLITVFPGTYSTATTAANGLLKDGVDWYFHPRTLLTKSTSGPLFRNNAFTSGANVYGYGKFQTSNVATNVYLIEGDRQNVSTVFEASSAVSSTTHTIRTNCTAGTYTYLNVNKIKIDNCTSSNGAAFYSSGTGTQIDIDFGNCQSTSTYAIYITSPGCVGRIKTLNVKSSTTTAVYCDYTSYASRIAFTGVSYIPGGSGLSFYVDGDSYANTSYFSIDAPSGMADILASGNNIMTISIQAGAAVNSSILWSKATLNGSATGWNSGSLSGSAVYLDLQGGTFSGEVTGALVQSGGKFEGVMRYSGRGDYSGATISGGTAVFTDFGHIYGKLTVSGGDVTLHNYYTSAAGNQGAGYNGAIALSSGTLRVVGMVKNLNTANTGGTYPCIDWTGGTLILHSSAAFYCGSTDSAAIKATGSMTGKIYGNVVSNTADTGTITWQVGTLANRIVDVNVR